MRHGSWIQPYWEGTVAGQEGTAPLEVRYERREAVELAFIAARHHLSARQRSVLILRDVLGFSAREAADALATTVASVNGALLRARRAADERLPDDSRRAALRMIGGDRRLRETAERFADAVERGETEAMLALLADHKPPIPNVWRLDAKRRADELPLAKAS
jgi:RNA polymerase sigma-70 factor (ECF subfamily)